MDEDFINFFAKKHSKDFANNSAVAAVFSVPIEDYLKGISFALAQGKDEEAFTMMTIFLVPLVHNSKSIDEALIRFEKFYKQNRQSLINMDKAYNMGR